MSVCVCVCVCVCARVHVHLVLLYTIEEMFTDSQQLVLCCV